MSNQSALSSGKGRTLLTWVTTVSSTSPLKGRNTTHVYFTSNFAKPVPSRILPCGRVQACLCGRV